MEFEVRVGKPAAGGGFVGRTPDNRVVFVRHALPGELVRAVVTEEQRSFLRADAIEVLEPAPERITPRCAVAGPGGCGGCDYQHTDLATQRLFKAQLVEEQLRRIAGVEQAVTVEPVTKLDDGWAWRTRVQFSVDPEGRAGFHRHRSHEVVAVSHCPIATTEVEAAGIESKHWSGFEEIEVLGHPDADVTLVDCQTTEEGFSHFPDFADVGVVVDGHVVEPPGRVAIAVNGRRFDVGAGGFFQVHAAAATRLSELVTRLAGAEEGDCVADLYCGVGLFAARLSPMVGKGGRVVGIERNPAAITDAKRNCKDLKNVVLHKAPVTPTILKEHCSGANVVILDPSREGAGKAVMETLAGFDLRRIVSVSCDPATFARDLKVLLDHGFALRSLRALDLFPQTEHVELVAVLEPS